MRMYYKTNETAEVDNYPYGYLKATAFFGLEHTPKKGFRTVFQTINPKTGRLNKEKKSTYEPILIMYKDNETNHIKYESYSFYDDNSKIKAIKFLSENFDLYTKEQIKDIIGYCIFTLKMDMHAKKIYCNADIDKLLPLYSEQISILIDMFKNATNRFSELKFDFDAIHALEDKNFNPFTTQKLN